MAKKDAAQATPQVPEGYTPRLKEYYFSTVRDELQKQFNYTNVHQIPKFEKIVVNMGVGEAAQDSKVIDAAVADLTAITGQKPLVTHARKSIANFKVRQGMAIGCKVTLRGDRMWEFLDRLIAIKASREPKYSTRTQNRCQRCGRPHSVYRKFGLCRVCFRELASKGELPGVRKASW